MSELQPQDDFIHPTGKEPAWREAFYFDLFDPESRLSSFGYVGVHPNQQVGDVIFALWKGDVLLGSFTRWDFNIPTDIGEERLGFGHLFFRPVDPFQTWQIFYDDGKCRLDLTFDAIHPAYSWGQSHGALEKTNSHHYEQQGRYTGEVRVDDQRYKIHGAGVRDHAWGWGARAGIRRWIWASAQFSREFAWNSFQVTLGDGRDILYGYIWRGEQNELICRSTMQAQYATRGQAPALLAVDLEGRHGDRVEAQGKLLNAFDISFQERNKTGYHYFGAAEYLCQGQVGYGQVNCHWQKSADRPAHWSVEQPIF